MKANNFYDSVAYVAEEIKRKALSLTPEKEIDELYDTTGATWSFQVLGEDVSIWETEGVSMDEEGVVTAPYGVSVAIKCSSENFDYWACLSPESEDLNPVFYSEDSECAVTAEQKGLIFSWVSTEDDDDSEE